MNSNWVFWKDEDGVIWKKPKELEPIIVDPSEITSMIASRQKSVLGCDKDIVAIDQKKVDILQSKDSIIEDIEELQALMM